VNPLLNRKIENSIGIVVIGRNEGINLGNCFKSLSNLRIKKAYVDSGSTDDSLNIAESFCDIVIPLDPSRPFSAARSRNEGFDKLLHIAPKVEFVQFIDGDCTLESGWLENAANTLYTRKEVAVVIGHLTERFPDRSPYNKLCDLEWRSGSGDIKNYGSLGGIMLVRANIFRELGGFKENVIAGEDSEFGVRIASKGQVVTKLNIPMATHDANMTHFSQWWKRSVRAGHAIGQRSYINGKSNVRDCVHERKSTIAWGIALPIVAIISALIIPWMPLLILSLYFVLFIKIINFRLNAGDTKNEAMLYAIFNVIGKIANGIGLILFQWRRIRDDYKLIEYK
jgi:GT2 family glycosyltransferase